MEEKMAPWNPVTRIAWALALLLAGGCTCGEQRPVGEPDDGSPTEPDDSGPGGDPGDSGPSGGDSEPGGDDSQPGDSDPGGEATVCLTVRTQLGEPLYEAVVAVQPQGAGSVSQQDWTDTDGQRCFTGLPAGPATAVVHEPFHWRPAIRDITVPSEGSEQLDITLETGVAVDDGDADWEWGWEYGQSFVATGDALIKATVRIASESQTLNLSLHQGGYGGSAVCSGSMGGGNSGRGTVAWASRGDCPLQSGASYFLNIVPASGDLGGWAPYVDRDQSYAGGSGYASSAAQDWDMGVTLEMEGDDLLTELAVISGGCEGWSSTFSQVFQARGTALRTAGFWVGGISDRDELTYSLREGGASGAQVGASKRATPYSDNVAVAAWGADEAPLVPGATYALELHSPAGMCLYVDSSDPYGDGYVAQDDAPLGSGEYDAWARIMSSRP